MATGGESSRGEDSSSSSGGGGMSAEQLRRMEENRCQARERLASRKTQCETGGTAPTHTATYLPTGRNFYSNLRSVTLSDRGTQGNFTLHAASHSSNPTPTPWTRIPSSISSTTHSKPATQDPSLATVARSPQQDAGASMSRLKFSELKRTIQANLMLISQERFEIVLPYDASAIDIFKRMPSNIYNAKTITWSFGVEVYRKLVSALQKECRHIELNQIPKSVLNLFLSQLQMKNKSNQSNQSSRFHSGSGATPTSSATVWSGVGTKLASTLMQFQRDGVEYCIQCGGRAMLADDMGLGKTLQAMAVMCHYRSHWPLLVICPASVKLTWAEAFQYWLPSLREGDVCVVLSSHLPSSPPPVTIMSYDLATRMSKQLADRRPDAIIVDECHFLKNLKTNRCKAILPLIKSATRCLLLSGTPALSRPIELYTQITALDRSFRMSQVAFGVRYCRGVKNRFGWDFSGASNLSELDLYMHKKFMIRRMKTDVLDQLPSKRRQVVQLDSFLTKDKLREVREMKQELDRASSLKTLDRRSALLPLFGKTGRLKLPAVRSYILDLLEGGRKLIVFGHHKSVLTSICDCLKKKKYEYIRIDGRTPVESRQLLCDRFQHDEKCLVAVLSITTANAGLTLTASSTVVFAELFWNPGILVQAEDRVYRIGQKNAVNIHYLVAKETVDDYMWPLIQSKLDVLNRAGLAGEDFSNADSTVLKGFKSQRQLSEFFEDLCTDSEYVSALEKEEEEEEEEEEVEVEVEVEVEEEDEEDGEYRGGIRAGSRVEEVEVEEEEKGLRKRKYRKKRKRENPSPCDTNAPDFTTRAQKLKPSPKEKFSSSSGATACTVSPPRQRTLTSMCREPPSPAREGRGRKGGGRCLQHSSATACVSTASTTHTQPSSGLAGYILSQHSRGAVCATEVLPGVCRGAGTGQNHSAARPSKSSSVMGGAHSEALETVQVEQCPAECEVGQVGGAGEHEVGVAGEHEVGVTGEHEVGMTGEDDDVMEWFKGRDDSDLVSFDDFEDD